MRIAPTLVGAARLRNLCRVTARPLAPHRARGRHRG
jgi:hypothetical protein